ncbi:ABC transporter permease [Candidatus Cardinium hertigii]|uniref:ABC transporter permease n=1 Tax=Candidatus Cardinium hertigii TaxID=247481 RepID=A0A3N2QBI6_9BACT|nr:FtsX-like permease family protein [Candidatus Cardinium hertigii]ROT47131.1 ABC transporter permease [Candidatus Cardinium hertigii]
MLASSSICFITLVLKRMRKGIQVTFSISIHKIVTLSIAIGTASILIASMVMLGFKAEIKKKLVSFAGHFEITKYNSAPYALTSLHTGQVKGLMLNLPREIKKMTAFVQKPMLIHTKTDVEGVGCKGLDPMIAHTELEDYLIAGRLPNLSEAGYQNELVISSHLAQKLSIQLGDRVGVYTIHPTVRFRKLKIVGIYCTYLQEIDAHLTFCDMRLMQRLNNWAPAIVNGYEIFLKKGVSPTKALKEKMLSFIERDLQLTSTEQKYARLYDWLAIIQKNTLIFIVFILLIAGFTMVATVMIQLMERSYMVGILKALGAHAWQINLIMLCNSLRTLFGGMVYGNILGLAVCFVQYYYRCISLEPTLYYMHYVPIYWNWKVILFSNLLIVGTICMVLYFAIALLKQKTILEAFMESSL